MIKAKKVLGKQDKKVLKTTNFPEITGVIYKLKGEIGETLYVSYDGCNLIYVGDELQNNLSDIKTKKKLLKELEGYRSLHDNDYKKPMKPVFFTNDYTEEDLNELKKYHF